MLWRAVAAYCELGGGAGRVGQSGACMEQARWQLSLESLSCLRPGCMLGTRGAHVNCFCWFGRCIKRPSCGASCGAGRTLGAQVANLGTYRSNGSHSCSVYAHQQEPNAWPPTAPRPISGPHWPLPHDPSSPPLTSPPPQQQPNKHPSCLPAGLTPEEAKEKPYIASMGIYVFKKSALTKLLNTLYPSANDFGGEIIPEAGEAPAAALRGAGPLGCML